MSLSFSHCVNIADSAVFFEIFRFINLASTNSNRYTFEHDINTP